MAFGDSTHVFGIGIKRFTHQGSIFNRHLNAAVLDETKKIHRSECGGWDVGQMQFMVLVLLGLSFFWGVGVHIIVIFLEI